jgi:FG-GAP repeat
LEEEGNGGGAYVFVEPTTGWVSTSSFNAELHALNETTNTYFSNSIAMSGTTLIIGASNADVGGNEGHGATYVFGKSQ